MKVFDLHSDLFTDIAWRIARGESNVFDRTHYPQLKKGGIDTMICVFWVEPIFCQQPLHRFQTIFRYVMEDLNFSKHARICRTVEEIKNADSTERINIFLGLEGMTFMEQWGQSSPVENVESTFADLHEKNIRHAIFAWNEDNFLASGTGSSLNSNQKGLTNVGKSAVQHANTRNWLLDVSHLDEASFWDVLSTSTQPVMASHSNARKLCNHDRNLSDKQLKAIAGKQGIIGLNAFSGFIDEYNPTIERFVDHAVYIADLVGPEYVAFGFDFIDYLSEYDLGATFVSRTKGLENVTQVPDLLDRLIARGFSMRELEGISYSNAFHFIKNQLKCSGGS